MTAPHSYDPITWAGFGDFSVTIARPDDQAAVRGWLEAEHFLGEFKPIGHSLIQIIREDGNPVAVIQWAACAYHLKDREAWIGWSALTCAKRRNLVVNNVRFLVLEAARRPNLASKSLAHAVRALPAQWMEHFGYEPLLCEPTAGRWPAARLPRRGERQRSKRLPISKAMRGLATRPQAGRRWA